MKSGIYQIQNLVNNKLYIGSAVCFQSRKSAHLSRLKKNTHHCIKLQHSWNKHGQEAFMFTILEEVAPCDLITREQFWIDSVHPWYNTLQIAGSSRGRKLTDAHVSARVLFHTGRKRSEESKLKMSMAQKERFLVFPIKRDALGRIC